MSDRNRRADVAREAAEAGADHAHESFRRGIDVETKEGKTDVVTRADREAQERVLDVVREAYPDDAVVGEEDDAAKTVPDEGAAWVVDPIDGTNNFVRGIRIWGTAVAAVADGDPVAAATVAPALGDTFTADDEGAYRNGDPVEVSDESDPERATCAPTIWWGFDDRDEYDRLLGELVRTFGDMRRFGCAQVTLALVATGALEATVTNVPANPWDSVAGVHMVRQAGGRVTDLAGDRWRHDSTGLVASNGEVHEEALRVARAAEEG